MTAVPGQLVPRPVLSKPRGDERDHRRQHHADHRYADREHGQDYQGNVGAALFAPPLCREHRTQKDGGNDQHGTRYPRENQETFTEPT
jgi:hypothetical protein